MDIDSKIKDKLDKFIGKYGYCANALILGIGIVKELFKMMAIDPTKEMIGEKFIVYDCEVILIDYADTMNITPVLMLDEN